MRIADRLLARLSGGLLQVEAADFLEPPGEPGIVGPGSVSWRVFGNPVSLAVGGVAAVLLELGEPRVRAGVWDHSSFRRDPRERIRRTGYGALLTVFAARSRFAHYAARVNGIHAQIGGQADDGRAYRADNPELLRWVQATAAIGFVSAYELLVAPLSDAERDGFFLEATVGAAYYGVTEPPGSAREAQALLEAMTPRLSPSPVLQEYLAIMRDARILPGPSRALQPALVRAALGLVPVKVRAQLGLADEPVWSAAERGLWRLLAKAAERVPRPVDPRRLAERRLRPPAGAGERPRS
jgi:uncharacterized protein (DUF2236 family)